MLRMRNIIKSYRGYKKRSCIKNLSEQRNSIKNIKKGKKTVSVEIESWRRWNPYLT